ncbi:MAG: NAD(P)-dependent dehydrogenase (short-subunit alcohol dehydrogenase family) [Cellvibrionaceae bacterium]|jgi:NAD(P)-dependent dehydrogenase (short-subunit alcohol dehydrogenase family)
MEFENKVILITGAGSGIGRAAALLYAKNGGKIAVSDIDPKGGMETVDMIKANGGEASFIQCNVADFKEVEAMIATVVDRYGQLDVAVNNAGIGGASWHKTAEHTLEDWDNIIAVNQTGVFYCMKLELQQMTGQGFGSIINIASIAGLKGLPNNAAYVASKHAVVGLTKTAAMEYAKRNIRVNAVCPVFTITNLFDPDKIPVEGLGDKLRNAIPMKRWAKVEEMAESILWLSSDKASFITGHSLAVDGGITA